MLLLKFNFHKNVLVEMLCTLCNAGNYALHTV